MRWQPSVDEWQLLDGEIVIRCGREFHLLHGAAAAAWLRVAQQRRPRKSDAVLLREFSARHFIEAVDEAR